MVAATSPIQELSEAARDARSFTTTAQFDLPRGKWLKVHVWLGSPSGGPRFAWLVLTQRASHRVAVNGVDDAIRQVIAAFPKAALRPDSVEVTVQEGPATASKLRPVAVQAWHEAFGLPVPTLVEVAERAKAAKAAKQSADGGAVVQLKSGRAGVKAFNERSRPDRKAMDLRKADLAGCRLDGVDFAGADLEGADLSGASLVGAQFWGKPGPSRTKRAKFVGSDLAKAMLGECRGADADFSRATLKGAYCGHGSFLRARFVGADLTGASLFRSDLRGADLTGATLDDVQIAGARYDEHTRWPGKFRRRSELVWKGTGPDPRLVRSKKVEVRPRPTDLAGFLDRLKDAADPTKLDKAMAMLKADRFRLFARVAGDHLVGVVKSQSDPGLVYSCRLDGDGSYSCCTQNLNICGGLRGSPCKHLLVLVVGLARAGELDPGTAHDWVQASRGRKPALDKDAMAGILLQYKGAEAGEVDWRPTETIPEDFYAM